jgi:LysR family glycine cleavage system transcriptional activator
VSFSRLPPLNALRAFEAVARHKSFRKAAEELFVTPAALTHQIKSLEELLGFSLFERLARRIDGQAPHLTVGATPTFVSRWLMPRLQRFLVQHPEIDVRLVASGQLINASAREIRSEDSAESNVDADIEIRFSNGRPEGQNVDLLFTVEVVPMCHPRLLKGPQPLRTPEDLSHQTLLHGDARVADRTRSAWARWLRRAGVTDVDPRRGLQLDHSTLALEAAVDGLGVTLAMPLLAAAELAEGKVAVAFPMSLSLDNAYYSVVPDAAMRRPEVVAFREWLLDEALKQAHPLGTRS